MYKEIIKKLKDIKKDEEVKKEIKKMLKEENKEKLKREFISFFKYEDREFLGEIFDKCIFYFQKDNYLNEIFEDEKLNNSLESLILLFLIWKVIMNRVFNLFDFSNESKVLDKIESYLFSLFVSFKRGKAFLADSSNLEIDKRGVFFKVAKEINLNGEIESFPGFENADFYFIDFEKFRNEEMEEEEDYFFKKEYFTEKYINLVRLYLFSEYINKIQRMVKEKFEDFVIIQLENKESAERLKEKIKKSYLIYKEITKSLKEKFEKEGLTYGKIFNNLENMEEKIKKILFKNF